MQGIFGWGSHRCPRERRRCLCSGASLRYEISGYGLARATQMKYTFAKREFEMKEFFPQDVGIIKSSSLERLLIEAGSLPSKSLIFTYMEILVTTYRSSLVGTACTQ